MTVLRRLSISLVLLCLSLWIIPEAYGADQVRVLLKQEYDRAYFSVIEGDYLLIDGGTGLPVAMPLPGEQWIVFLEGLTLKAQRTGDSTALSFTGGALLAAQGGSEAFFRFGNNSYPGDLHFIGLNDRMLVVNSVNLEDYLIGVLAEEMSGALPMEALKAQAVVSRTLATYRKSTSPYYDLTAQVNDQLYRGYDRKLPYYDNLRAAVAATEGEKIFYDGSLIEAVFHANAGGMTASSEDVWGGKRPYLQSVASPFDVYALEYPKQSGGWPANSYEWSKSYSRIELSGKIAEWSRTNPDEAISIGTVLELRPHAENSQVSSPGRVTHLDIIGTLGTVTVSGEKARQIFDLRSTRFTVEGGGSLTLLSVNGLSQWGETGNLAVIGSGGEVNKVSGSPAGSLFVKGKSGTVPLQSGGDGFNFYGRGFGHGVGLSQWGAIGMAEAGYNYQEIIEHYYNQGKFDGRLQIRR